MVLEHSNELLDSPCACPGVFRGLKSEQDREPILAIKCAKEGARLRSILQCCLEISRHGGNTGRIIGCLPPPVLLGPVDFCQARWLHAPFANQPFDFFSIDLGPDAAFASRGELLEPTRLVVCFALTVDPAVAERHLDRFGIGHRAFGRSLLCQLDPLDRMRSRGLDATSGPRLVDL